MVETSHVFQFACLTVLFISLHGYTLRYRLLNLFTENKSGAIFRTSNYALFKGIEDLKSLNSIWELFSAKQLSEIPQVADSSGWFLQLSGSDLIKIPFKHQPHGKSKRLKGLGLITAINRIDGRKKWIKEIDNLSDVTLANMALPLLCELSKELLYSGIPEQSVELFHKFFSRYGEAEGNYDYFRFCVLTVRALTRLDKLTEAISLLKRSYSGFRGSYIEECSISVPLDLKKRSKEDTSLIRDLSEAIAELAVHSKQGLKEALALKQAMVARGHTPLLGIGSAGLLKGLRLHFLTPDFNSPPATINSLLLHNILDQKNSSISAVSLSLSLKELEALAHEIANPHLAIFSASSDEAVGKVNSTRRAQRVVNELVRVLFRTAAADNSVVRSEVDMNYQPDISKQGQQQTVQGLSSVLSAISEYQLQWDAELAETLLDECMRLGGTDTAGISLVVRKMWENHIHARASTFNALLRRYAESGDAESAYNLLTGLLMKSSSTNPNSESWSLVLTSCLKSRKGRFYAQKVFEHFFGANSTASSDEISKDMWDQFLQLKILRKEPALELLADMVQSKHQPDSTTLLRMYESYSLVGDVEQMLSLYRMQCAGAVEHGSFTQGNDEDRQRMGMVWNSVQKVPYTQILSGILRMDDSLLPPGTKKEVVLRRVLQSSLPAPCSQSVLLLLELLRDRRQHEKALEVLDDLLVRSKPRSLEPTLDGENNSIL